MHMAIFIVYLFSKFAILDKLLYLSVLKYPTPTKDSRKNSGNALKNKMDFKSYVELNKNQ